MDIEEILGFQPDLIFFVALALGTPLNKRDIFTGWVRCRNGGVLPNVFFMCVGFLSSQLGSSQQQG